MNISDVTLATSISATCSGGLCGTATQSFKEKVIASLAPNATPAGGCAIICTILHQSETEYKAKERSHVEITEQLPPVNMDADTKVATPHVISA